jgi:acetylglutamate kinase
MGLVPVVVHGAGLYTGRQTADVKAASLSGDSSVLMAAAQEQMQRCNAALVAALEKEGVGAASLMSGVFSAARDMAHYGGLGAAAGSITGVCIDSISAAVEVGCIPIVAALSSGAADAPLLTFSTNEATLALTKLVRPLKVISLRSEGGLRNSSGAAVRSVDLARDAPALLQLVENATAPAARVASPAASIWADHYSNADLLLTVAAGLDITPSDALCLVEMASLYSVLDEPGATVGEVTTPFW